jgi:hypothetical protein
MGVILRRKIIWLGIGLAVLAAAAVLGWVIISSRAVAVKVPQAVVDKALFTIYVPLSLPPNYQVVEGSFASSDGVLVFSLQNDQGHAIAVTEQGVPASFDFTNFYSKQIRDGKKLSGQFESVLGQVVGQGAMGTKLLSVRTDSTWVIATSQSAQRGDLEYFAQHLRKLD